MNKRKYFFIELNRSLLTCLIALLLVGFIIIPQLSHGAMKKVNGYPDKPITFVIPFGFGGGADTFVRTLAVALGNVANIPINATNIVGGGFASSISYMMNQPTDGYTIIQIADTVLVDDNLKRLPVDFFNEFIVLLKVGGGEAQIYVKKDSPFKSFQDLVKYGKENPGKIKIGGSDAGGTRDLGVRQIFNATGIKGVYIPFTKGSATTSAELLGGRIDADFDMELAMKSLLNSGDVRMLVTSGEKRLASHPQVPTFDELGYTGLELSIIRGVAVRKGTPPERVEFLRNALKEAMSSKLFEASSAALGIDLDYKPGEEFTKMLKTKKQIYLNIQKEVGYLKEK